MRNVTAIVIRDRPGLWSVCAVEDDIWSQDTNFADAKRMIREAVALTFNVPVLSIHVGHVSYRSPLWLDTDYARRHPL
ncbi:hypothetical protein [Herbiconiux sp. A18JL235]|uniref:DUF2188 domain-containing protein n=1 Tax=Herbiconiux sp. A18JL235 TaxID=3152363 RepID=A0AB39BND5_9MICO